MNGHPGGKPPRKIKIQGPSIEPHEDAGTWNEVRKFAALVPSEVEPNIGRVQEIKEEIEKGTYLTNEVIEETAARLAIRFMKKE